MQPQTTTGTAPELNERRAPVFGNRLLDVLPRSELEWMVPSMRRVFVHREQQLVKPGESLPYIYFPVDSALWVWAETIGSERPIFIGAAGRRGAVGLPRLLGLDTHEYGVSVLAPGTAWRFSFEAFEQHVATGRTSVRHLLLRYAMAQLVTVSCRLACNSQHNIDQRLARWIVWLSQETGRSELSVTHQQIADLAAIRRPSVSLALSAFQRDGSVRSHHGRLHILDHERLEDAACSCCATIDAYAESVYDPRAALEKA